MDLLQLFLPRLRQPLPIHSKTDLYLLQQKACDYARREKRLSYRRMTCFYRDKSREDMLLALFIGRMEKYEKDHNGDPLSPINGRLEGLHFSVNVHHKTGKPMPYSVYGNTRLSIPADLMFRKCPNLYFADFFCLKNGTHHITLVMTRPRSQADYFCARHLPLLDPVDNIFFRCRVDPNGESYYQVLNNGIWIEVFFTEDIDMTETLVFGGSILPVNQRNKKRTGPMPKDCTCRFCNI